MKNIMIEISQETDKLIKSMSRMGEIHDDVIRRGFSYLDKDSNFWNQE